MGTLIGKDEMERLIFRQIQHHRNMIKELQKDWKELNERSSHKTEYGY